MLGGEPQALRCIFKIAQAQVNFPFNFHVLRSDFPMCSLLCYIRTLRLEITKPFFCQKKWNNTGISTDISSLNKKQVCWFKGFE